MGGISNPSILSVNPSTAIFNAALLQGRAISSDAPTNGQALVWSTVLSEWVPATVEAGEVGTVYTPQPIWSGTSLAFDLDDDGEADTTPVNLKGDTGDQGPPGPVIELSGPSVLGTLDPEGGVSGEVAISALASAIGAITPVFACVFEDTGSGVTIISAKNIASITRNALNNYKLNFTTTLTSENYLVSGFAGNVSATTQTNWISAPGNRTKAQWKTTQGLEFWATYQNGLLGTVANHFTIFGFLL